MKRDDVFIRELLFEAEDAEYPIMSFVETLNMDEQGVKRLEHARLLCDVGFFANVGEPGLYRMTNFGHDYLAAIRDDTIWKKTKDVAAQVGGTTLGVMSDMAIAFAKQKLKEVTGLDI